MDIYPPYLEKKRCRRFHCVLLEHDERNQVPDEAEDADESADVCQNDELVQATSGCFFVVVAVNVSRRRTGSRRHNLVQHRVGVGTPTVNRRRLPSIDKVLPVVAIVQCHVISAERLTGRKVIISGRSRKHLNLW